jgi:hypothetical protein
MKIKYERESYENEGKMPISLFQDPVVGYSYMWITVSLQTPIMMNRIIGLPAKPQTNCK